MELLFSFLWGIIFHCFVLPQLSVISEMIAILLEWATLKIKSITDNYSYKEDLSFDEFPKPVIGFQSASPETIDEEDEQYDE